MSSLAFQLRLLAVPLTGIADLTEDERAVLIAAAAEIDRLEADRNPKGARE